MTPQAPGPARDERPQLTAWRSDGRLSPVLRHDPDLLAGLEPAEAERLSQIAVAPRFRLDAADWRPPTDPVRYRGCLGLLVLEGFAVRTVACQGRTYPEVLGRGDVVRPWDAEPGADCVAHDATWRILEPASLVLLDARFAATVGRFPTVLGQLMARATARSNGLALSLAISQIRSARTRLLLLLWSLADRWGRMTPEGAVVPIPLTHQTMAHLVCLQRPTASTALQQLRRDGEIDRRPDGCWILRGAPPAAHAEDEAPAAPRAVAAAA